MIDEYLAELLGLNPKELIRQLRISARVSTAIADLLEAGSDEETIKRGIERLWQQESLKVECPYLM